MKVENMTSSRGNKIANQFIIINDTNHIYEEFFQSYDSIIVKKSIIKCKKQDNEVIELDKTFWDYSVTTGKQPPKRINKHNKEKKMAQIQDSRKTTLDTLIKFALINETNLKKVIVLLCNWIPIQKLITNVLLQLIADGDIKVK